MTWKLFNPCEPCCNCTIKEWESVTLDASSYIETPVISKAGYRLTAYLDIDATYSAPTWHVVDDPDIYDGLRFEIIDSTGGVLEYAEMRDSFKFYLDQEFTPLVEGGERNIGYQVYSALSMANGSVQYRSTFDTYGVVDATGEIHSHNNDSTASYSTIASVPFVHDQDVKLRLHNTSDSSMYFPSVIAERIIDTEQVSFDSSGCPTSTPSVNNADCTADLLCSVLEGNRVHRFAITDDNLAVTLSSSQDIVEYDGCGSILTYGPFSPDPCPLLSGSVTATSTGGSCYNWDVTSDYDSSFFVRNVNNCRLTVEPYHTLIDDCTVQLNVTLTLNYIINPQLGYPTVTPPTYSYVVRSFTTFNTPSAGAYSFSTDVLNPVSLGWQVNVPRWKTTSAPIRLYLADATAPASIPLVTDFVFTDGLNNCPNMGGSYGYVGIDLSVTEIMVAGAYIEITGY